MSYQTSLFAEDPKQVINISKVTHRSPFRYPGGKTWLVPHIRRWMQSLKYRPEKFIEPFAGGAIVGLSVAFENMADTVILVEMDEQVSAVWKAVLGTQGKWLADRVSQFELSYENASAVINDKPKSIRELAFQTLLKNRIYHGGILAEGSGMLKNGENGKGIHSRWYPETIKKRLLEIAKIRSRFTFIEGDGLVTIEELRTEPQAVWFMDPPYTAGGKRAGNRLYRYFNLDHDKLFKLASSCKGAVLLTYDDAPEVRELAKCYGFDVEAIAMQNTHLTKMNELLIGKDLSWIRS